MKMKMTRWAKLIMAALGLTLFILLIWKTGLSQLLNNMQTLGWGLLGVVGIGGLSHVVKAWAWSFTFDSRWRRQIPFRRLLAVRLAGEAVAQVSFAGQTVGETTRALLMKSSVSPVEGVASVILDRGMFIFTSLIAIMVGIWLSLVSLRLSNQVVFYQVFVALLLVGVILLLFWVLKQRLPLLSAGLRQLGKVSALKPFAVRHEESVQQVEALIFSFHERSRFSFWCSLCLNLVGHLFSIVEVWAVLWLLNLNPTFVIAFVLEVFVKILNIAGGVVPGNLGIYEAGIMVISQSLGFSSDCGLTLALARRTRSLFWTAAGLTFLMVVGFRKQNLAKAP